MSYKILVTDGFKIHTKGVSKKHRSLKSDLEKLIASLQENPLQGEPTAKATSKAIGGRPGFCIRNSYKIKIECISEIPYFSNYYSLKK